MPAVHDAIDVNAPPEACWRVLTDLSTWPSWFPFLKKVRALDGAENPFFVGGRIQMRLGVGLLAVPVNVTVEEVDPVARVRWVGGGLGVTGDHWYSVDVRAPGTTRFTSHEEFSGPIGRLWPSRMVDLVHGEVHKSMERFKSLVESQQ